MAPHPSYKKHVKFAKSKSPILRKKSAGNADSYANKVLHYLSKLKGLFQSTPHRDEDSSNYYNGEAYDPVSKSILKKTRNSRSPDSETDGKLKAYKIVSAAIQYGCANDIIEKVGNYFLVKGQLDEKIATRRPTPGPDYIRCASCKNLAKFPSCRRRTKSNFKFNSKNRRQNYYEEEYGRASPARQKRSTSNTSVVNYCSKCYARMKSNTR